MIGRGGGFSFGRHSVNIRFSRGNDRSEHGSRGEINRNATFTTT